MRKNENHAILNSVGVKVEVGVQVGKKTKENKQGTKTTATTSEQSEPYREDVWGTRTTEHGNNNETNQEGNPRHYTSLNKRNLEIMLPGNEDWGEGSSRPNQHSKIKSI